MKIMYYINKFVLITTAILYLTIFLGLYAQIVLGAVQVLSALLLFIFWKKFNITAKKQVYLYWVLVIIYSFFWVFDLQNSRDSLIIITGIMIIPMSIASYFFYVLNSVKNVEL